MNKSYLNRICGFAIILYIVFAVIFDFWDAFSYSVSLAVFFGFLYEKYLWRFDPFNKTPKIYGEYVSTAESTYDNGTSYESYVTIKQTLSKITITERMRDGVCVSIVSNLFQYNNGQWFLFYTYLTHPKNEKDDMHYGTSVLYIDSKEKLEGFYYTNRIEQTKGKQVLIKRNKENQAF